MCTPNLQLKSHSACVPDLGIGHSITVTSSWRVSLGLYDPTLASLRQTDTRPSLSFPSNTLLPRSGANSK